MTRISILIIAVATAGFAPANRQDGVPSTPDNTPFYQGVTDEASLERIVEVRLDRAKRLLLDLLGRLREANP
jgi:hypothetical protein